MLKKSTPHCMLYGDLGRCPLSIRIKKGLIGLWYKFINNDYNLSSILYRIIINDSYVNNNVCSCLNCVKDKFNKCGLYIKSPRTCILCCHISPVKISGVVFTVDIIACTGHFVMVPLNMTYLHCLQQSLFEHLFNLY